MCAVLLLLLLLLARDDGCRWIRQCLLRLPLAIPGCHLCCRFLLLVAVIQLPPRRLLHCQESIQWLSHQTAASGGGRFATPQFMAAADGQASRDALQSLPGNCRTCLAAPLVLARRRGMHRLGHREADPVEIVVFRIARIARRRGHVPAESPAQHRCCPPWVVWVSTTCVSC